MALADVAGSIILVFWICKVESLEIFEDSDSLT